MSKKKHKLTPENQVVYSTTTGEEPKGGPSLTTEATTPLPPPEKLVRRTTTKKHTPRVNVKAEPLHTNVKVHKKVWAKAQEIVAAGVYTKIEVVDAETVVVR